MCFIHVWVDFTPKIWHLLLLSLQINKKCIHIHTYISMNFFLKSIKKTYLLLDNFFLLSLSPQIVLSEKYLIVFGLQSKVSGNSFRIFLMNL